MNAIFGVVKVLKILLNVFKGKRILLEGIFLELKIKNCLCFWI